MSSRLCNVCSRRDTQAMYKYPTNIAATNRWKLALKIPEKQAVNNAFICYQHFPTENIEAVLKINYTLRDKDGKFSLLDIFKCSFSTTRRSLRHGGLRRVRGKLEPRL